MPRYRVMIEFDVPTSSMTQEVLDRVASDMQVQLESLGDGTYDEYGIETWASNVETKANEI